MSKGEDAVDRLYGLPLEEFIGQRNRLARELRAQGQREEAAKVAKLAKPSLAAWAANQVLRSQPAAARELLAAGRGLTKTQQAALRGRSSPAQLRDAIERHRRALAEGMQAARGLLDGKGHGLSQSILERVERTLTAASLDPALTDQAASARFDAEQFFSGFDQLEPGRRPTPRRAAGTAKPASPAPRVAKHSSADGSRRQAAKVKAARRRSADARSAVRAATRARDAAARARAKADAAYDRAERSLAQAVEAKRRADEQLAELESASTRD